MRAAIAMIMLALGGCAINPAPPVRPAMTPAKPQPAAPQAVTATEASHKQIRVALLLPLSGSNAQLGQAMLDAANLAVYDQANKSFALLPEDTGDTPDHAQKAAQHAVAEGAQLILGPLFATAVTAVAPVASAAHVPVISFTTDASAATNNLYVMGFLPSLEVRRVVSYAAALGTGSFAVLAPDNAYGNLTIAALQSLAPTAIVVKYAPGTTDFTAQAKQLKAAAPGAILLPEGGNELRSIAKALAAAGINPAQTHLLGTGLWDDPALAQEPELIGGWYAGTAPTARADFEKRFTDTYKYTPQRLCTLAYDATALAVVLAKQAGSKPPFDQAALTRSSGFAGLDGVFRFGMSGQIERALAVLQVSPAGPAVIDAAPKAFAAAKVN